MNSSVENLQYDVLNRITNDKFTYLGVATPHGVSYDAIGDIVKKVGLCASAGCMQYSDPNHAHAVSSVTTQTGINYVGLHTANLVYDANGNMTCVVASPATACGAGDAKDIAYTAFNMTVWSRWAPSPWV